MRFLSLLLPFVLLATPAMADDAKSLKDHLPSEAEIENIIAELPDFNHMMDGLIEIAKDEELREKLTESAEHMQEKLEESGALELRDNGLPDFNAAMAVMLRTFTDKEGVGGMLDTLEEVGKELETIMEESFDKELQPKNNSSKSNSPSKLNHSDSKSDIGLTDI